jgi:hypothetical protein
MKRITIAMLAVAAAMLASGQPAMAASCNGNGHQVVLSNGSATPGTGTTSTAIRFSVRYTDTAGCAPTRVVVVVQGVGTYPLSGSGSDYSAGVTFSRTLSLPAGSHAYSFKATSGKKSAALSSVSPLTVLVTAPTPRPKPTPAPPKPTPKPQPAPPPPPSAAPTAAPTARPTASPTADATSSPPDRSPVAAGVVSPSPTAIDGWWLAMQEHAANGVPGGETPRTPGAALEFVPELAPSPDDLASFGILASFGLTTVGGLAFFFILLRTRRGNTLASSPLMTAPIPGAQVSAVASPAAPRAPTLRSPQPTSGDGAATPRVSPLPPMRELIPPIDYDLLRDPDERLGPAAGEADIPRWLRPSVRAGRFGEEPIRRRDWGD